jgi:hypothetical protein
VGLFHPPGFLHLKPMQQHFAWRAKGYLLQSPPNCKSISMLLLLPAIDRCCMQDKTRNPKHKICQRSTRVLSPTTSFYCFNSKMNTRPQARACVHAAASWRRRRNDVED